MTWQAKEKVTTERSASKERDEKALADKQLADKEQQQAKFHAVTAEDAVKDAAQQAAQSALSKAGINPENKAAADAMKEGMQVAEKVMNSSDTQLGEEELTSIGLKAAEEAMAAAADDPTGRADLEEEELTNIGLKAAEEAMTKAGGLSKEDITALKGMRNVDRATAFANAEGRASRTVLRGLIR